MARGAAGLVALAGVVAACSGSDAAPASDAGVADRGTIQVFEGGGAAHLDAGPLDASMRSDRVTRHAGMVLPAMHVRAIYVTKDDGAGGAPSFDDVVAWALTRDGYWSILAQYGVGLGVFDGRSTVQLGAIVSPSAIANGVVASTTFAAGLRALLHPAEVDAGAGDASAPAEAGSGVVPVADAYIVFLPDGLDIEFAPATATTCTDVSGYHDHDGDEPFAVIPPCALGRSALAITHELTEMATDPAPGFGWYSDGDASSPAGGEIADLCPTSTAVLDGRTVARLWSNADGDCVP